MLFFCIETGTKILLWSLKYIKEGPVYELWLEETFDINPRFDKAADQLPQVLSFYWKLKVNNKHKSINQPK